MRPRLASTETQKRLPVWVLGPPELAESIVSQLTEVGFPADDLETPRTENELRVLLRNLSEQGRSLVHPGLSRWAERPEFPQLCEEVGLVPVCPSARILSLYQNKLNLLSEAEKVGIANLALSLDPLSSLREIQNLLEQIKPKFPIILRSLKGGAGHGVQLIRDRDDLEKTVPIWFEQLERIYGDAAVIVEKSLPSARHIIVPFIAQGADRFHALPWIDGSLQTRWKRMIQFCPATSMDSDAEKTVNEWIRSWAKAVDYVGVGSLEFLIDGKRAYLIDGNARLNAAFPLWEEMMGIRSAEWQLAMMGFTEEPEFPTQFKWKNGVSMRLYAEDPVRQIPTPGYIQEMSDPRNWDMVETRARFITAYSSGMEVPWKSSGVIGELFVFSQERKQVIQSARKTLSEVWIAGSVQTNQRFVIEHLDHPFVRENLIHAGFSDDEFIPEAFPDTSILRRIASLAEQLLEPKRGNARWVIGSQYVEPDGVTIQFLAGPVPFEHDEKKGFSGLARFSDFNQSRFMLFPLSEDRWLVQLGAWSIPIRRVRPGAMKAVRNPKEKKLVALCKGRVHAVLQREGADVSAHEKLIVIESLGSLVQHAVPVKVKLKSWLVETDQVVEQGQDLAELVLLG